MLFEKLSVEQRKTIHNSLSGTWSGKTGSLTKEQVENMSIKDITEYWYDRHFHKYEHFPLIKTDIYTKFIDMKSKHLKRMKKEHR